LNAQRAPFFEGDMTHRRDPDPLGLEPRDRARSSRGSTRETSYDAARSDPYTTDAPHKDPNGVSPDQGEASPERDGRADPAAGADEP
jgi:hypothetical protein